MQAEKPALAQLINTYEKENVSVIGVQEVPLESVHQYGIIHPSGKIVEGEPIEVKGFVEKPKVDEAPSNLAIMGRYILTPTIFNALKAITPGAGGEIQLTDAIQLLSQSERIVAHDVQGKLYDCGSKIGFMKATIDFALQREDLRNEILTYIKEIETRVGN